MGFWFKSRYRYILLLLSCIALVSLISMRPAARILLVISATTLAYLASIFTTVPLLNLHSFKLSAYMFSSWALHYIFIYLIVVSLVQIALKRQLI